MVSICKRREISLWRDEEYAGRDITSLEHGYQESW